MPILYARFIWPHYYYMELNTAKMLHDLNINCDMPEEMMERRLCKVERAEDVDGVGIGLYLTRDIVNKQNGYIKVESDEKGTTFSLFLKKFREQ